MVACLLVPGFELRAALRERPRLALEPAALAPEPGAEPLLGPVTAAAEQAGVRPNTPIPLPTATPVILPTAVVYNPPAGGSGERFGSTWT